MARKLWKIAEYNKAVALKTAEECGADEFAVLLLNARGITDVQSVSAQLFDRTELSDPFLLKDMDRAVERIMASVENGEKITVYGDYDADGVTSTVLLYSYLETIGADVHCYIPSRMTEGYGLSLDTAQKLVEDGTRLVVTVDNGINAVAEVEYLSAHGVDMVVTDHHRAGDVLPAACAVVDPHRADDKSEFKELAGVGVALKLVAALEGGEYMSVMQEYADLAAIGTIADIVSLTGENRTLVCEGLESINSGSRCGIRALREVAGKSEGDMSSTTVAFTMAPRINAAGRMDKADTALSLLLSEDYEQALLFAKAIDESNVARQETEADIIRQVASLLSENEAMMYSRVLVVDGDDWHPGVIGIVASRLVEKYGKPAIVISRDKKTGVAKGSGRSVEGFSLFDALTFCSDKLLQFGGHTLAAGFSVENDKIDELRRKINTYAGGMKDVFPKLNIDCRLNPANLGLGIFESLNSLEPFGAGNPMPVFGLMGMTVKAIKGMGGNKHLRLMLSRDSATVTCVKFGMSVEEFPFREGDVIDIAVRLDKNDYYGDPRISIQIKDMRPAGSDDLTLFRSLALYEKVRRGDELTEQERAAACPSRAIITAVFKLIKESGAWCYDIEILCFRLGLSVSDACRVSVACQALTDCGILTFENGQYIVNNVSHKTDLTQCEFLARLGYTQ